MKFVVDRAGFSMVQLMFAIAIMGVLAAFAIGLLLSGGKERRLSLAKTEVLTNEQRIFQTIQKDLDRAIKVTGSTLDSFPGIRGRTEARPTGENSDSLTLYIEEFGHFSHGQIAITEVGDLRIAGTTPGNNELGFIHEVITQNDLFLITNLARTNILERKSGQLVDGLNQPIDIDIALTHNLIAGDFAAARNSLRAVTEVVYELNDREQLIRRTRMRSHAAPFKQKVISDQVKKFHIAYVFQRTNFNGIAFTLDQQNPFPSREAPLTFLGQFETNPPLTWSDIRSVQISLETATNAPHGIQLATADASDFSFNGNELTHRSSRWIEPEKYSMRQFDEGFSGDEICPVNDRTTHCTQRFSHCFQNTDREAPDWRGFGDLRENAPYCNCVGDQNGGPGVPGDLDWLDSDDRAVLNQCAAAFDGCNDWNLSTQHPGMQLVCSCLQNPERLYNLEMNTGLGYQTYNYRADLMPQNAGQVTTRDEDAGDPVNEIRCRDYQNLIATNQPGGVASCDASAQRFFAAEGNIGDVNAWANACGCLTFDRDANNNDTAIEIDGRAKNFGRLCGVAVDNLPRCDNTVTAAGVTTPDGVTTAGGVYRTRGAENPQGLTPEDAGLCACIQNNVGRPDFNPPDQANGGVFRNDWDFRENRILNPPPAGEQRPADPEPFQQGVIPPRFGSAAEQVFNFNPQIGGDANQIPVIQSQCAVNFCRDGRTGTSCCAVQRAPIILPPGWPTAAPADFDPELLEAWSNTHSGFCNDACTGNEVQIVRERITGTAQGGRLPNICGGPNAGGGATTIGGI